MARISSLQGRISSSFSTIWLISPFFASKLVNLVSNLYSPPKDNISLRIFISIFLSTSVPIWGLLRYRISGAAPNLTKVSSTKGILLYGSFTMVFSFPSEKVPAPPSPNCTLVVSDSSPVSQNLSTVAVLLSTSCPCSTIIGFKPEMAIT